MQTPDAAAKRVLFLVFPGPNYDLTDAFAARLGSLSKHFKGLVLTRSPQRAVLRYGSFSVITTPIHGAGGFISALRFFLKGIALSSRWRLKGKHIDLVVTYSPLKVGLLGVLLGRIAGARVITEVNGDYVAWAHYAAVRNSVLRRLKRKLNLTIEAFVLQHAHGIKLLYPEQIDYFQPLPHTKIIRTFPDYVNLTEFRNLGEENIVLLAGFPFFIKGVDILVSAFKQVAPKYPNWRLKILGWYPDLTELNACIAGHTQIFHHQAVHHRDMPEHIGRCAIFVLPSRTEAMGRVLLEAMAAGKPRIGAEVGGIPTVIEHGVDGFLFKPEDVNNLARLLDQLMGDPQLRKALGDAGQRRAANDFSAAKYFTHAAAFYHEVLSKGHAG